jgi:DNA polymerase-4/DNA polymerase V
MSAPLSIRSFPRAILHIDGDAFFASCEQMQNPSLRGKPVVTGLERGIASSVSYEAKARGVSRAMSLQLIRRICPDIIVLPSDYELYSLMSIRMYDIVRRYTDAVEEYGIDECFAELTGLRRTLRMNYREMAERIKNDLDTELGVTFSVGLAPTKVLAKVASKWKKPSGLTIIPARDAHLYLEKLEVGKLWGIGSQTASYLAQKGVKTALDFALLREEWVEKNLSKPFRSIWYELRGDVVFKLETEKKTAYKSISKTKTFTPPSNEKNFVFAQLSKNVENACIKARRYKQASAEIYAFIKTNDFRYQGVAVKLARSTALPDMIINALRPPFEKIFNPKTLYRSTGVVLTELEPQLQQQDLFGEIEAISKQYRLYEYVDKISEKYGKHSVFLGSSFLAHKRGNHQDSRATAPERRYNLLKGETKRKRIAIPLIGDVR